jgi:hypothetical protein
MRLVFLATFLMATSTSVAAMSGQVSCRSQSLTACQDDYCFVVFDTPSEQTFRMDLDFDRQTYVIPDVDPTAKSIQIADFEQTKNHYAVKFPVRLADDHTGYVQFIANTKSDGSLDMSAASRGVYPATSTRSAIISITALRCTKTTD